MDKVRRAEFREDARTFRVNWQMLFRSRWLWLKNPGNLSEPEKSRLERIDQQMLATGKAYQMRLVLQRIYESATAQIAAQRFGRWCRWWQTARPAAGPLTTMLRVAKLVEKHVAGILAYWHGHITNAFMEGLNSVFSAVKRRARGYRTIRNIIAMLYFVAGKLPEA